MTFALLFVALSGMSYLTVLFFIIGQSTFFGVGILPPEWFTILTIIFRTLFNFLVVIDPLAIMRNGDVKNAFWEAYQSLKFCLLKRARPVEATDYNKKAKAPRRKGDVGKSAECGTGNLDGVDELDIKDEEDTCGTSENSSKRQVSYSQEVKVYIISDPKVTV